MFDAFRHIRDAKLNYKDFMELIIKLADAFAKPSVKSFASFKSILDGSPQYPRGVPSLPSVPPFCLLLN
jgi:hypothetical protein